MKILIAVDGSEFTARMLDYLGTRGWLLPTHSYTLINVTPSIPARAKAALDPALVKEYYQDEAEKVFAPIRPVFEAKGLAVTYKGLAGHAAEAIANEATSGGYDLIVMGSHGHSTLGNLLLGSVATRTLAECKTPVLLIR